MLRNAIVIFAKIVTGKHCLPSLFSFSLNQTKPNQNETKSSNHHFGIAKICSQSVEM